MCRSFLGQYFDENGNEVIDGRNNLGVVTISPLGAALKAGGDIDKFWEEMETLTDIAYEALMFRVDRFKTVTAASAPILYQNGSLGCDLKSDDVVLDTFKNGFSSVSLGYFGLHEVVTYLTGEKPFYSKKAYDLQLEIMQFMKAKTDMWKKDTGYAFSGYASPNEACSTRVVKIYKKKYGEIPEILDHHYLTNSFHLDVCQPANAFQKIDYEAPFIPLSSGGFVTTVDMPNLKNNVEAHEKLVDYAYYKVPYFMINQPVDECYVCDHKGEFEGSLGGYVCPKCGNSEEGKMNVTRRVSGYLSDPDARPFNIGKQNEVIHRVKHVG